MTLPDNDHERGPHQLPMKVFISCALEDFT
jgi:hypothetical protein